MSLTLTLAAVLAANTSPVSDENASETQSWVSDVIRVTGQASDGYATRQSGLSRSGADLIDVPQSIQVLSRTLLTEQELTTLSDALRNVSGASPTDTREAVLANPLLRGFEAEVFVDGLIAYGDTAVIDPSSLVGVERIEVAKGPTSALFGGGTGAPVGGLINLVTKTPSGQARRELGVQVGSENRVSVFADLDQPLTDTLGVRLAVEQFDSDDHIDAITTERLTVNPSLTLQMSDRTALVVRGLYNRIEQLEYSGLPTALIDTPGVDREQFTGATDAPNTTIENTMLTLELNHQFSEALHGQVRVRRYEGAFDEYASFGYLAFFPLQGTQMAVIRGSLPTDVEETTLDANLSWSGQTGAIHHDVLAGVTYDVTDYSVSSGFAFAPIGVLDLASGVNALSFGEVPPFTSTAASEYRTTALYAQNQMQLGDRVHFLISGRYSEYTLTEVTGGQGTDKTYTEFDPRLGVTVNLSDQVSAFAGFATGSRLSLFFAGENGAAPVPETSTSYEAGFKFDFESLGLFGTISAFEIKREDVPTASQTQPFVSVQSGEQRSQGVEADLIWEPSSNFSLLGAVSLVNAEVSRDNVLPEGAKLPRNPEWSGRLAARYRFSEGRFAGLGLGAGLTYTGETFASLPNGIEIDAYTVADAQISYERDAWRVGLSIENLFDTDYVAPYQYLSQDLVRPGRPRSAWLSLSHSF